MSEILQRTLDGLLEAGPYALIALGLTLSFGVLRRLNLAFGATALLAAYVGSWLHVRWGIPFGGVWLAVIASTVAFGFYVEWVCFAHAENASAVSRRQHQLGLGLEARDASLLAASFALWMQLEQLAVNFQPNHLHPFPDLSSQVNVQWGVVNFRPDRMTVFLITMGLMACMAWWLQRSKTGLGLRAVASDPVAAHLCGLNVSRIRYAGTALSCVLCGISSCAVLSMDGQVTPMFGMWVLLKGLTCALIGGLGSVRGALGGAVLLGITEAHAQAMWGALGRDATTWALLLLALLTQAIQLPNLKKLVQGDRHE